MIKLCHFCALRCTWLEKRLQKRFKKDYSLKCDSWYTKVAFLWGDGIKDIIQQCQKENEVTQLHNFNYNYVYTNIIVLLLDAEIKS